MKKAIYILISRFYLELFIPPPQKKSCLPEVVEGASLFYTRYFGNKKLAKIITDRKTKSTPLYITQVIKAAAPYNQRTGYKSGIKTEVSLRKKNRI